MTTAPDTNELNAYLGDGVNAKYIAGENMIWLETVRFGGVHRIALEPEVFDALTRFAVKCWYELPKALAQQVIEDVEAARQEKP